MSLILPDSSVNLYKDIPISNGHELVFSSREEQNAYFLNKRFVTKAGCSYIRKTGRLRIEFSAARVNKCNFMSFTNTSFENVTFYAQILDFEYVNNETTDIIYAIDWWQTYMFDADYHACSILREHLTESDYQKAVNNPWRRDVPELLTDEGLPCDKSLEKLYSRSEYFNNFTGEMASLVNGTYSLYTVLLISEFDYSEWSEENKTEFMNQIEYFGGNIDPDNPTIPTSIDTLFGGFDNNFPNAFALIGVDVYNTTAVNKILDLLTINGVSGSIIGIYVLPDYMLSGIFNGTYKSNAINTFSIKPQKYSSYNPKLNTYPFRYLRIYTPQDVKEYRLDLFLDMANGDDLLKLEIVGSVNGLPRLTLYPIDYKYNTLFGNFYERINFENFPQVSYSTDAYLTFLSGQYAQALTSNTFAGQANLAANLAEATASQYKALPNVGIGMALSGALQGQADISGGKLGGLLGEASTATDALMLSPAMRAQANYETARQNIDVFNEAQGARNNTSTSIFNSTKRAYINDQYVAGSSGCYGMYSRNGVVFDMQIVSLNDDILQKYSDYFENYGYKSLRTGIPHICDYVSDGTNAPHFSRFDGETFTYVQTENMHVTGVQQVACNFIENLFNSGCRFLKGD